MLRHGNITGTGPKAAVSVAILLLMLTASTRTIAKPLIQDNDTISPVDLSQNLARGKRATQSSTGYGGSADRGVDGVKDGGYGFHTDKENNPWWQVDLGAVKSLGEIHLFNRRDCCSERARTIQVLLSDDGVNWKRVFSNPGTVFGTDGTPLRVSVKGLSARYVRLQLTEAEYFHLGEVEVYGSGVVQPTPPDNNPVTPVDLSLNLARGKRATQSSTGYGGSADRGVDGVKDGGYGFHTDKENNPWWQVDLGAVKSLGEIHLFNRRDCCSERARTIQVLLSDDGVNWKRVFSNPGTVFGTDGTPLRVSVKGLSARYVRLQLTEAEYFHLGEVEVYGSGVVQPTPPDNNPVTPVDLSLNLARGKRATQSSTGYGGTADRGVDGVKDGGYGFHTDKENNPWWQVDLGAVKSLGEIHLFNRRDCCSERARTIQVLLSDDGVNWKRVFSNPGTVFGTDGTPLRVSVKGLSARYVRLQLTEAEYFHLGEVEVY